MVGILFDLDGTLLDSLGDLTDSVNYALSAHGYPIHSQQEICSFVGNGVTKLIQKSVPQGADYEPVLQTYLPYYAAHNQIKTAPYAGILQALEKIKNKYPVAVVSNKQDAAVKPMCKQWFGDVYALGEREGCPRKPKPDMLFKAMQIIGADQCVYVGDSEVDVLTAANANVPCVSVTWGFRQREELKAAGASYLCDDPLLLPEIIDKVVEEYYGK